MDDQIKTTLRLVNLAQQGKTQAIDQLMERYLPRVLRIVRLRLGPKLRNRLESMDVVQEVMTRIIKDLDNFSPDDEAAFVRWVSRLVQNEIYDLADYHQAKKRSPDREIVTNEDTANDRSVLSGIPADSVYRPSVQFQLKEDVLRLEAAMDQLSEAQKDIIVMRQYEELKFKDIAASLECSEDAARMKYVRAIDALTDVMRNERDK